MTIYAASYYDDNGITVRLFKSEASAIRWREEIAKEFWDCHFFYMLPTDKTDKEIADHYFTYAPEYFSISRIKEIEP